MSFNFGERRAYLRALHSHGIWELWIGGAWIALSVLSFIKTETLSLKLQDEFQLVHVIPALSLQAWGTITALLLTIWIFEASFRHHRKVYSEISSMKKQIGAFQEVLRPKLKTFFSEDIPGCVMPTKLRTRQFTRTGQPMDVFLECTYYRLEVRADCIGSVPKCIARLTWIKKNSELIFSGEQLILPFVPAESPTCDVKDVLDKLPEQLDVLAITQENKVIITTKGFVLPNSYDFDAMFSEPAEYILHLVIAAPNQPSIEHDLVVDWTGDRKTAKVRSATH